MRICESRMKLAWLLILVMSATPSGAAQDIVGDFSKSPTEHIINQIEQPFVVRSVEGVVIAKKGSSDPLAGVLFEIQGPDNDGAIRKGITDARGQFKIGHTPVGTYRFKATLDGFQSVMGRIIVSKKANKMGEIKVEMPVGV